MAPRPLLLVVWLAMILCMVRRSQSTEQEKIIQDTCRWDRDQPFSRNIHCLLERHRRQTRPDYEVYGHPCMNYISLVQPERRVGFKINHLTDSALCDRTLKRRWYRFQGPAGGVMPETCIEEFNCGTHAPVWLNGQHPAFYGEVLDMPVCVSLSGDCCERTWYIRVANCGEFFTYLLTDTPGCFMAYCAGRQDPCPPGLSSVTGFSPGCSDNFPPMSGEVEIHVGEHGHEVAVYCDYTGPIPASSIIETEWFVDGDNSGPVDAGKFPVFVDSMRGRRRSILQEGHWIGKMGSNIYCRQRARWANRAGVPSPYMHSEKHFAGIKISQRVIEVSESSPETNIQLQATMPVACLPQFSEACKITVELSHDPELGGKKCIDGSMEQVVFGDCSVDITPENWRQVHNVTVKAVRDFYRDGNKNMRVDFKPIYSTTTSPLWDNYRLPEVEVIAQDAEKALCSSTGDPHYNTFDGLYYHVYLEGEFVLYKNTRMPIQINTRLEECGKTVSCNCAVAVKAADDVIVIDRCKRRRRNLAYGSSFPDGWKTLHRHALEQGNTFVDGLKLYEYDNGRRFTIHLPTGSYIDFKVGEHWINIYLYGSSDDWRSTLGLCGTFDGDRENDFTFPDGFTKVQANPNEACGDSTAVCKFAEAWRVSKEDSFFGDIIEVPVEDHEFFNDQKYCKCQKTNGESTVMCNYHYDVMNCQGEQMKKYGVDKTNDVMIKARSRSERHRRSTDMEWSDDIMDYFMEEFVYNASYKGQVPRWPTPSGITVSYARRHCEDIMTRSRASVVCNRIIQDKMNILIDECMTDIKITDDLTWAMASLTSMTEECQNRIHEEPQYWETPGEEEPNQYSYENSHGAALLQNVCPGDCSQKGTCYQGSCECIYGYEGDDCSTSIFKPPQIYYISEDGLCDQHARPCHKVKVHGTGFRDTDYKLCVFETENGDIKTTTEVFVTFEELFCLLPETQSLVGTDSKRPAQLKYGLSISQGRSGGGEAFRSNNIPIVVYDSRCYDCDIVNDETSCTRELGNGCLIDDVCYGSGERNPLDCCQQCDPTVSGDRFTPIIVFQPISLYPRQTSYTTSQGSPWKLTIRAFGGSGCDFHYSPSLKGDAPFTHVVGSRSLQMQFEGGAIGHFQFDVTAIDPCGGNLSRTFDVTSNPRPSTEAPSLHGTNPNCEGNTAPVFAEASSLHVVLTDEVLTIKMNASDPDGDHVGYYVLKRSDNYVTISEDGHLRYHAGSDVTRDKLTVEAEDICGNKSHHLIIINAIKCACVNGGTCVNGESHLSSATSYSCACTANFTGELCDVRIE